MRATRLEAAVILGIVIPQISSISISSAPPDCLAAVDACMSDLCRSEEAFHGGFCNDGGCQIKGSEVCNMTIQTILDQFPSLRGCVCAWEEELCGSIQALATQCHRKPARQQKRRTVMDWKSSRLIGYVHDGAGSCFDRMRVCVGDAVCNRHLAPVLQACAADRCDRDLCQRATRHFYGGMPQGVAEVLAMCECEASDQSCLHMKATLHSGTCGDEIGTCQDRVNQCAGDSSCRPLLKTFQAKCWHSEEVWCSDLRSNECFTEMDPALILGTGPECKTAFLATLGTALHRPCSCKGMRRDELHMCIMIHDVLHNRSHFLTSRKSSSDLSEPPEINEPEHGLTWSHDYLFYAFAAVLLVAILMLLAVVSRIWILRKRDKAKFHHPQKSNCVVIL